MTASASATATSTSTLIPTPSRTSSPSSSLSTLGFDVSLPFASDALYDTNTLEYKSIAWNLVQTTALAVGFPFQSWSWFSITDTVSFRTLTNDMSLRERRLQTSILSGLNFNTTMVASIKIPIPNTLISLGISPCGTLDTSKSVAYNIVKRAALLFNAPNTRISGDAQRIRNNFLRLVSNTISNNDNIIKWNDFNLVLQPLMNNNLVLSEDLVNAFLDGSHGDTNLELQSNSTETDDKRLLYLVSIICGTIFAIVLLCLCFYYMYRIQTHHKRKLGLTRQQPYYISSPGGNYRKSSTSTENNDIDNIRHYSSEKLSTKYNHHTSKSSSNSNYHNYEIHQPNHPTHRTGSTTSQLQLRQPNTTVSSSNFNPSGAMVMVTTTLPQTMFTSSSKQAIPPPPPPPPPPPSSSSSFIRRDSRYGNYPTSSSNDDTNQDPISFPPISTGFTKYNYRRSITRLPNDYHPQPSAPENV